MRAQHDLSAVKSGYARSLRFIRGENVLYALRTVYARAKLVIRAQHDLYAVKTGYARSLRFMRGRN